MSDLISKKYTFSFDCETDGLYGATWAVGAVVIDNATQNIVKIFTGMLDPNIYVTDQWVKDNIVPYVKFPVFSTRRDLNNAFWRFWMTYRDESDCVVDCGYPVESLFMRECVQEDLSNRQWKGPYPMHEVATMFVAKKMDADTDRIAFSGVTNTQKHNPVDDSYASAICWLKLKNASFVY